MAGNFAQAGQTCDSQKYVLPLKAERMSAELCPEIQTKIRIAPQQPVKIFYGLLQPHS